MALALIRSIREYIQSWFRQTQIAEVDDGLVEIPSGLQNQLLQQIQKLPTPTAYRTYIQKETAKAIKIWQQDLEAPNILVFLSSPVESISKILTDSLTEWPDRPLAVTTPIPCSVRPHDPLRLIDQMQEALKPYEEVAMNTSEDPDAAPTNELLKKRNELIVIPCLEQCFLRCIGGWDGIEYLRNLAINHRNCFWVIGCNHWAWDFLDFVCQISAYFSEAKALPELDGTMLQDWLAPIAKLVVEVEPDEPQFSEDTSKQSASSERRDYWDSLASKASGISQIAARLWLHSLRIEEDAVADKDIPQIDLSEISSSDQPFTLKETKPRSPSLPSLQNVDRYLLHSLLIHGRMTQAHLAFSLGQAESQTQYRIQWLLREGLIERCNGELAVKAAYYTKLKTELANNNFFIGGD